MADGTLLAEVWLWQRRGWGYVLAAVLSVKGAVYMLALVGVSLVSARAGFPDGLAQVPLWGGLGVGFVMAAGFLVGNVRE